jgi:type IV pilus assembly protein PilX
MIARYVITGRRRQRGLILVSSLLLLVIVTILAVSMFRSFGVQEKIAGNTREKQRALHAAESAQQYAEWWLSSSGNATTGVVCNSLLDATGDISVGQVCSNKLSPSSVTTLPWQASGADVGVAYAPPNMTVTTSSAADTYYRKPRFYISYLGATADSTPSNYKLVYQIDAVGYGGSANAVAIVESTYYVSAGVKDLGAQ